MHEIKWFYDIILIIYGVSLAGYFIDFIQNNQKAYRTASWLLSVVWLLQTVFLLQQLVVKKNFPVLTLYDGLSFYAWVLISFSFVFGWFFRVRFMLFFINLLGFFILLLSISTTAAEQMQAQGIQLVHEMLIVHIALAIISYGFFTISFVFSLMYLVQYRFLKRKKGFSWVWRIGDLTRLDQLSFKAITTGVPILTMGIILGVVWAYTANAEFYWLDPKTIGSIAVLAVYVAYLYLRVVKGYQGRPIAVFNVAAFLILLINFFLFSILSNFHLQYVS